MRFLVVALLLVQGCKSPSKHSSIIVEEKAPTLSAAPKTTALLAKETVADLLSNVESEQYYGVYLTGQKAGWAREMVTRTQDGGVRVT
ncbi:MAG TPA: hypothetical protein EYN06_06035, partial [Myxococcales bacterium]|nr:hypothetical protein [Myxococcales bacterium]